MGKKGRIGILTGGGDVPGLNPAIRAVTVRALSEGYDVVGIRRGWAGLVELVREDGADNSEWVMPLTRELVEREAYTGGTFLHSSRTRPSAVPLKEVPAHARDRYSAEKNDLTPEVLANLEFLGVDAWCRSAATTRSATASSSAAPASRSWLCPRPWTTTCPGTDYCMGFGTCVSRTIQLARQVRTSAASHERIVVLEVFGRYAGFTALLPTFAGAAQRCVIPEQPFYIERLAELLVADRNQQPRQVRGLPGERGRRPRRRRDARSRAARRTSTATPSWAASATRSSKAVKELAPRFNDGRKIDMISMDLGYNVRSGDAGRDRLDRADRPTATSPST